MKLRLPAELDIEPLWHFMLDPESSRMAAFGRVDPAERAAFDAKWRRIFADPAIVHRTIVSDDDRVLGAVASFVREGDQEITYWLDRAAWGQGIASEAVRQFLPLVAARPLFGRVAADNVGSRRVLEKNGFVHSATERGFADARGEEIDELVLILA